MNGCLDCKKVKTDNDTFFPLLPSMSGQGHVAGPVAKRHVPAVTARGTAAAAPMTAPRGGHAHPPGPSKRHVPCPS